MLYGRLDNRNRSKQNRDMAVTIRYWICFIIVSFGTGCITSNESITICDKKYDIHRDTDYNYEQKLNSTFNIICFRNSRVIAFAYQSAGFRNDDSNLVYTSLIHRNDSLILATYYKKDVYGYPHQSFRYYKCIRDGLVSLNSNNVSTKRTARKKNNKLKR